MPLPEWCRAHGEPIGDVAIRRVPEDFRVTENLGVTFSNDGEHDLLQLQKIGANTDWVARQLAAFAGVKHREVGYSGLKDRHAVTTQWFSVPRWHAPDWQRLDIPGVSVVEVQRHNRKLRRGTHRGNRFHLRLRDASVPARNWHDRLTCIRDLGVPNYFGEQRFGRNGNNVALVDRWAGGSRLPRHQRSLAISSARSLLFNNYLSERVDRDDWNQFRPGDIANLDGTGSVFSVDVVDADIARRCDTFDIHPTGPLLGDGEQNGDPVDDAYAAWLRALQKARVKAARRSLRIIPVGLEWQLVGEILELSFELGRGAYATAVLRELANTRDEHA